MALRFLIFICVAAIICLIVMKKIRPEIFKPYLIWVLFILAVAFGLYGPWGIFG